METAANPAEAEREPDAAAASGEWHFAPDLPIENNPLFTWPLDWRRIVAYNRDYWLTLSEVSLFLIVAVAGWALLAPLLGDMSSLSFSWIGMVLALNYGLVILVAGGFHLFFYTLRRQGDDRKYVRQFGHRGGARFTFGMQVHDNMFWSLASGVPVWTGYEVLLLWMHANGWSPGLSFGASPVMFLLVGHGRQGGYAEEEVQSWWMEW